MGGGRLARHPAAVRPRGRWPRWLWRVHEHLLPRQERHGAAGRGKSSVLLGGVWGGLGAGAGGVGGGGAGGVGGGAGGAGPRRRAAPVWRAVLAARPLFS